jgi:protein transport protein SEC31
MLKVRDQSEEKLINLGLLGTQKVSKQPIRCIASNFYKQSIVATGSHDVLLYNFSNGFKNVEEFVPAKDQVASSPITAVSWNNKVVHIFASASEEGTTTLWDLKNKKSIMTLTDPNQNLAAFNPEPSQYLNKS